MKKNVLIVFIILIIIVSIVLVFFYLGKEKEDLNFLNPKDIPNTLINRICSKISQSDDFYYCLAVANKDAEYCQNLDMPNQVKLCKGMATEDVSFCEEIQEPGPKKMCYYELSFETGNFNYCNEAEDPNDCYFAFIHRLHWESRADEIKPEYCEKLKNTTSEKLILKNCCLAFKEQDVLLCGGNRYCLSFFKQPLSFCDTEFKTPSGLFKNKDDCLVDRAMSEKDYSICAEIGEDEVRDMCYGNMSTHIFPAISLCEEIIDEMRRNMCYAEVAINLAQESRENAQICIDSGGTVTTSQCCTSTNDFPDDCAIGACGCAPEYSHEVKVCNCGEGKCFSGFKCTTSTEAEREEKELLEKLREAEEMNEQEEPEQEEPEQLEQIEIPLSYHIKNPPYYREDGFCWGASAIMLMIDYGLPENEVQNTRTVLKSGLGGTPDMFLGFGDFGVMDKIRIAYSKDYIKEFADFYNQQVLATPEEQIILLDDQVDALNYLKKLVSSDILVIADIHYGNHFVVITGYDENYIYINDPGYDNGYEYEGGSYGEHAKLSINQFLKEWGISRQEKTLAEMEGAIGWPGDYGMIWLKK